MKTDSPEAIARSVIAACTDCEVCRFTLTDNCLLFAELYRLHDREADTGRPPSSQELRAMLDRCTFCALCGCPDIRADIIAAKSAFAERDGLSFSLRLLQDVARLGRLGGLAPRLSNHTLQCAPAAASVKRLTALHPSRRLPAIPPEAFTAWARRQRLDRRPAGRYSKKVAYFAGCSGRYFFPDVPRALVRLLREAGTAVFVPPQGCCGMPPFLEGDRPKALEMARTNLNRLAALVAEGFDIVCSCPTCGYVLKKLVCERAYYAEAYQRSVGAGRDVLKIPAAGGRRTGGTPVFNTLRKSIYGRILKDDGYFASIDPLKRIAVAANTWDAGEYLAHRVALGDVLPAATPPGLRLAYFVPCHQREQGIGRPYLELLRQVPGVGVDVVDDTYDCCGMGGIMGYKRDFHARSLKLGAPVVTKIEALEPDMVVTDCLSCRLQLVHMTTLAVRHPLEILAEAYR